MKYTIEQKKPDKDQIIVFKVNHCTLPEIGIWSDFKDNLIEVYIPAKDDAYYFSDIEWWMPID